MATSKSLNPYSNGSYFLTNVANVVTIDTTSLNPYSNGSYFLTVRPRKYVHGLNVLILILMEVTF